MSNLLLGKVFSDFDSGIKYIEDFCIQNCHPIKHGSKTTVAQYNRKIRAESRKITELPESAIYSVRLECKHFGEFKSRSQHDNTNGKSRKRTHFSRGCKFFVYLAWNRAGTEYAVKSCDMTHSHDVGANVFQLYPDNRYAYSIYYHCYVLH